MKFFLVTTCDELEVIMQNGKIREYKELIEMYKFSLNFLLRRRVCTTIDKYTLNSDHSYLNKLIMNDDN